MAETTYKGEVMLLRWSESADSGMTVTLKLDDGPDGYQTHPMKGLPTGKANGQRFAMVLVPISETEEVDAARATGKHRRWDELKPSQQMGIACNDPAFWAWLIDDLGLDESSPDSGWCADELRAHLGIDSRREADFNSDIAGQWDFMHARFVEATRLPEMRS